MSPLLTLKPAGRRVAVPLWAVVVVALWLAAVAVLVWYEGPEQTLPLCVFRRVTGVPCPTCGTTRAVLAVGAGRPGHALLLNPFVGIVACAGIAWLILRVGLGRRLRLNLSRGGRRAVWGVVIVLFFVNWGWVIWRELG